MNKICYAKYNRTRIPEFQTKTLIVEENGEKKVVKEALFSEGQSHIQSFLDKYVWINDLYQNIQPVNCTFENGQAVFPCLNGDTVGSCLELLLSDRGTLLSEMKKYMDKLFCYKDEYIIDFEMTQKFENIFGVCNKNCKALKIANIDEIFDNFIIDGNQIYLIDYEWVFDFPIPLDFIRFRSVYYFYVKNGNYLSNTISLDEYLDYFGYDSNNRENWIQMDDAFQQYVHGKDRSYIYTKNYTKDNHDIKGLLNSVHDIGGEYTRLQESLDEKNNLIIMKDKNIEDFRENEATLNKIIEDLRENEVTLNKIIEDLRENEVTLNKIIEGLRENEVTLNETIEDLRETEALQKINIGQLYDKISNQEEYIQFLRRCMRNPFFALEQVLKKIAKKILPEIVQVGLYCLFTEGIAVFIHKLKNYTHQKNQYEIWLTQNEKDILEKEELKYNPLISVVVPVYNVEDLQLIECIESVRKQTYENWELCLVDDCSTMESVRKTLHKYEGRDKIKIVYREENGHISRATNSGIEVATGEFIALLDCDDLLAPNALLEMARMLNANPDYDFIYSDEDKLTEDGKVRKDPFFKPDWSPDTFMSLMYTCHFSMFRKALIDELGGMRVGLEGSQDYDLVLRVMEKTTRIGHIPKILYHWRERQESTANSMTAKPYIIESTKKAKLDALERRGLKGYLECIEPIMQFRVVYEPIGNPKVSVIIPSKDNYNILKQCITTIKEITAYSNYEIIIVDNGSNETNKKKYEELCTENGCIYEYRPLQFNFSQMCNIGAKKASGDYYLFLNDDIEIKGAEWMSILLGQAQVPHVGAVGCKLLYPNSNLIQHVGVLNLEIGPGHAFHKFDDDMNYYYGRNILDYNFSIVTGACLMVSKDKFEQVKGFEEKLPVAYNDVELCFKLLEKGYHNVLRNDVKLVHHESISRGYDDVTPEKIERQKREMEYLYKLHPKFKGYDPCYNPNLVKTRGDFSLDLTNSTKLMTPKAINKLIVESDNVVYNIDELSVSNYIKISGWAFEKEKEKVGKLKIILVSQSENQYELATEKVYRPDVAGAYGNKKLCFAGFQTMVKKSDLEAGNYKIYLELKGDMVLINGETSVIIY